MIKLRPSTCWRHPGLGKADACEWPLRRARALPWLVAPRLPRLRREALRQSAYPFELNTRLGLLEGFACILQLVFGSGDEFTVRPLDGLRPHFGKPQSFQGVRAERLCA